MSEASFTSFKPAQNEMTVRLGETNLAFYTAHNPTEVPVAGQASYNVAPDAAGGAARTVR